MAGRIQSELWEAALDQYGFVTSKDAKRLNINLVELGKLSARGQLKRLGYGIYRFPRFPTSPLDAYIHATLWANGRGVLSHDTALELHELCDINPTQIHITVPVRYTPDRQGGHLYTVHCEELDAKDITKHEGIPIVREAVAIAQGIQSGVPTYLVRQALETATRRGSINKAQQAELAALLEIRR